MKTRRRPDDHPNEWQYADKGNVWELVFAQVPYIEERQSALYERFVRLEALYDPNNTAYIERYAFENRGIVNENVIASNVDTVKAVVATTEISPRVETDGADWSQQRRARHLEWYSEGLMGLHDVHGKCRKAFKEAAKKGTGFVMTRLDRARRLHVEHVFPEDIIINDMECRFGDEPRQLHWRRTNVSKEALKVEWPELDEEIDRAGTLRASSAVSRRVQYTALQPSETVVIESWYRPLGTKGTKYYRPGRHTICCDGVDLLDEKWEEDFFPVARIVWEERAGSYYGIGGAERIVGHQLTLNKLNWQIDRQHDQLAVPTTYVRPADANLATKTTSRLGTIAVYNAELPHTVIPQAFSPQTIQYRAQTKESSFQEFGQSQMTTQATKPAGIDSGIALREYKDQTTQRFATQEHAFEALVLRVVWLMLYWCKKLGNDAPVVLQPSKFGKKKIEWKEVDMGDLTIQLQAAATLSRTPAGRLQTVLEWAQAGIIAQDEARRLLQHPDLNRSLSLYTAALDKVEYDLEQIADGKSLTPDPMNNLLMTSWRAHMQYEIWCTDGAPEEILEELRNYISIAEYWRQQGEAANQNAAMGAAPGAPGQMPPGQAPDQAPNAATPASALNVQAAQAVA